MVVITSGGQPVPGTLAGIRVYTPKFVENSEPVIEADKILSEYAMKAVPMKYTIQFLDFVSERSKSKTGSSEGESYKVGYTIDMSKLFAKESTGEISGEYEKSLQTAFSYYVDQGKKYLIDSAYIKLVETYRDKLIGLDYTFKKSKYKTDIGVANSWMSIANEDIDRKLDEHFDKLRQIAKK